jgi:hypothetical protein
MSLATQIDYKIKGSYETNPVYRYLRVPLNNLTSGSIALSNASQLLEFKLPSTDVYNLAKSHIAYTLEVPASAVAGTFAWYHEDTFTLADSISFGTAGGENICDLTFADRYTKIARKIDTKVNDFLSNDTFSQLYPCNQLKSLNVNGANTAGVVDYLENRYVSPDDIDGAIGYKRVAYPLKGLPNTVFAMDKDLYFGNEMYIRINTAPLDKQVWSTLSAVNPSLVPLSAVGVVALKNVYLYLAIEKNELINDSIRAKFNSGNFHINVPYTRGFANSTAAGVANINLQITKQYGKRLMQVMHTVFDSTQSKNTSYNCTNIDGSKISQYRTYLDSRPLQDYALSTKDPVTSVMNGDDWYIANKRFCHNSVILNKDIYSRNWFHIDRFYEENQDPENQDVGMPLTANTINWIIETTTAGNNTHYTYLTFRRGYTLNKDGVFPDAN